MHPGREYLPLLDVDTASVWKAAVRLKAVPTEEPEATGGTFVIKLKQMEVSMMQLIAAN